MEPTIPKTVPKVVAVSRQGRATIAAFDADRLERVADVTYISQDRPLTRSAAAGLFAEADIVALTPKVAPSVDEKLLRALPRLRGIALYATGYDFLDVGLLDRYGVVLTHLPDYSTTSVAEHALGLLLTLSRRIHLANDRSRGVVDPETSLRGFELAGRTLGVVGLGRIGARFAHLGQALGMRLVGTDPRARLLPVAGVTSLPFKELLQRADAVCVLCSAPYGGTAIIGPTELAAMRPGSVLVNASRASLVDADAAAAAVRSRRLRGYAVDDVVFSPLTHASLLAEGRIVQTGHCAWWSDEALERGGRMWAESIRQLALGCPVGVVTGRPAPRRVETESAVGEQVSAS